MADDRVCEIITKFFLGTCQSRRRMTEDDALVWRARAVVATTKYQDSDVEAYIVPLITEVLPSSPSNQCCRVSVMLT